MFQEREKLSQAGGECQQQPRKTGRESAANEVNKQVQYKTGGKTGAIRQIKRKEREEER